MLQVVYLITRILQVVADKVLHVEPKQSQTCESSSQGWIIPQQTISAQSTSPQQSSEPTMKLILYLADKLHKAVQECISHTLHQVKLRHHLKLYLIPYFGQVGDNGD